MILQRSWGGGACSYERGTPVLPNLTQPPSHVFSSTISIHHRMLSPLRRIALHPTWYTPHPNFGYRDGTPSRRVPPDSVQGCLAHKKHPSSLGPAWGPGHRGACLPACLGRDVTFFVQMGEEDPIPLQKNLLHRSASLIRQRPPP